MVQKKSLFVRVFTSNIILFLFTFLLFQTCSDNNSPTEPPVNNTSSSGAISTGEVIQETSKNIGTEGGTVEVTNSDSPINGLKITVPQKGYNETRNFTISYAPITSHTLGENFKPISPMISIKNGGDYSEMPMSIKVPIKKEIDEFAVGILYDEITGKIEVLPTIAQDESSITVNTRHFATSTISRGTTLKKGMDGSSLGNLVISSLKESILSGQAVVSSGFTPGVDDWEFPNFGSYIAPKGHCAGQSITAMWYYYEKTLKGEPSLFHRFDKINNSTNPKLLWQDNPRGYRFASIIHKELDQSDIMTSLTIQSYIHSVTWKTFIAAMLLTGEPQFVGIMGDGGHALIVYKINVTEGKMYIADPNYPNNRYIDGTETIRTITYSNGKFNPYKSYAKVGTEEEVYDKIAFYGKTSFIEWPQIAKRYAEMETEQIGNDRFPEYELKRIGPYGPLPIWKTVKTDTSTNNIFAQSYDIPYYLSGTDHYQAVHSYNATTGEKIASYAANGMLSVQLSPGKNTIGFYVLGATEVEWEYLDFKWVDCYYTKLSIEPNPPIGKPNEECKFTAFSNGTALKGNSKYVWIFGDNTDNVTILNDSTVTHVFKEAGTYEVEARYIENSTNIWLNLETISYDVEEDIPTISDIAPNIAKVGEVVHINGRNFGTSQNNSEVWFSAAKALASDIVSWGDTQIDVKVPEGAVTGDVHIVVDGEESNYVSFTVEEESDPNDGYWVLYDTKEINGCSWYESECWPLEDCSGSAGNYSITIGSSTCSNTSGWSGSGSYTLPPSQFIPGDTLTFETTASGSGYTRVDICYYADIENMSFDEYGYNTGDSPSRCDKIVSCWENSSPAIGKYKISEYPDKDGALLVEGSGSIGTRDTSRRYFFLYKWQE